MAKRDPLRPLEYEAEIHSDPQSAHGPRLQKASCSRKHPLKKDPIDLFFRIRTPRTWSCVFAWLSAPHKPELASLNWEVPVNGVRVESQSLTEAICHSCTKIGVTSTSNQSCRPRPRTGCPSERSTASESERCTCHDDSTPRGNEVCCLYHSVQASREREA